ncbi:MAG TPA: SIMPL domain-containing protein [Candidatus Acidoferrum sp.]|nr:SIMPL domain-containing protein [Candidatus Acidoferrum sp.]
MKSTAVLFFVSLILAIPSFCQEHPSVNALPNSVYVGADGKFEAPPDTAQLQFSISVQDDTSQKAYQGASRNVEQVRQVLRANGIDPKLASFGFLSVQPVYEWKPKQHVVGYRVTSDVLLKLKDFSKVGAITQQLADANVSETQTLNYTLENMDEAKNHSVEDAYRRARNSAEIIAHASGRTLGDLSYASVDTFENVRPVMPRMAMSMKSMAAPAAPTEEFTPQTVSVTAHVNALFNLK